MLCVAATAIAALTDPASTVRAPGDPRIPCRGFGREQMAIAAMRLPGVHGGDAHPAQDVLSVRHRLKMRRIDAGGNAAQMVQFESVRNGAAGQGPGYLMGPDGAVPLSMARPSREKAREGEDPVTSFRKRAHPDPTREPAESYLLIGGDENPSPEIRGRLLARHQALTVARRRARARGPVRTPLAARATGKPARENRPRGYRLTKSESGAPC